MNIVALVISILGILLTAAGVGTVSVTAGLFVAGGLFVAFAYVVTYIAARS